MKRGFFDLELIILIAMGAIMVMLIGLVSLSIAQGSVQANTQLISQAVNSSL